jgi:glycolate oxidase iron-sulfur subunit
LNRSDLIAATDLCVKCGLCLPHCPTYVETRDENESPRGRISLIQGWATGALGAAPELTRHVDNCLLCRACEAACPAYVPYGGIVDRFRQETGAAGKPLAARLKSGILRKVLTGPSLSRLAGSSLARRAAVAIKNLNGTRGLGRGFGIAELAAGLPETSVRPIKKGWTGFHPAENGRGIREVLLFQGCTAALLDSETMTSAIRLMNRLEIGVRVPEGQTCCGALHWHAGEGGAASERMARNLAAFESANSDVIASFASGCAAMLRDYGEAFPSAEAKQFSERIRDIGQFLAETPWPKDLKLRSLPATVCVHSPCSLKNVLRADRHAPALLRRIPDLKVVALPAQTHCCGAAGSYLLEHPQMAQKLRDDVLERILASKPDYLVTSNPGCAMHLRAGLKQRGREGIEVVHWVTLLARSLTE